MMMNTNGSQRYQLDQILETSFVDVACYDDPRNRRALLATRGALIPLIWRSQSKLRLLEATRTIRSFITA